MREAKLPIAYRDSCANLLIPLNRCRAETYYLPWKCSVRRPFSPCRLSTAATATLGPSGGGGHAAHRGKNKANRRGTIQDERHSYEKCQYDEFKKRVVKMNELREAKEGARSN